MNKQTYKIIDSTLAIPGIPGEWHAGQEIDVDVDTNTVLAIRPPITPGDVGPQTIAVDDATEKNALVGREQEGA